MGKADSSRFAEHFRQYVEEMRQYDPDFCEDKEIESFMQTVKEMCVIMPVKAGQREVGFVAISAKDCHPSCGWYIHHAFVEKAFRHRKFMTKTMFAWLMNAPDIYGYDVIKDSPHSKANSYAEKYWKHLFEEVVGKFMDVRAVNLKPCRPPEVEEKLHIHAYRVSPRQ